MKWYSQLNESFWLWLSHTLNSFFCQLWKLVQVICYSSEMWIIYYSNSVFTLILSKYYEQKYAKYSNCNLLLIKWKRKTYYTIVFVHNRHSKLRILIFEFAIHKWFGELFRRIFQQSVKTTKILFSMNSMNKIPKKCAFVWYECVWHTLLTHTFGLAAMKEQIFVIGI